KKYFFNFLKMKKKVYKECRIMIFILFTFIVGYTKMEKGEKISEFKNNYKFNNEIESELIQDSLNKDFQWSATNYSQKGDHKKALEDWDLATNPDNLKFTIAESDSLKNIYSVKPAKDYIVEQSKKHHIIVINESHHISSHRVFTRSMLEELFVNGYRILCLEALNNYETNKDSLLNTRKYPIQTSGFYTKDPQFGNFIRTALDIGFEIYPYESSDMSSSSAREIGQAQNLQKIIDDNPNSKVLVHCGSGHAIEGEVPFFGGRALAGRIKDLNGFDPLTIDQVFYSEKSEMKFFNPFQKVFDIKEPSILFDDTNNKVFSYNDKNTWIDIVVFHPKTEYIENRPDWLMNFNNKLTKIQLDKIKIDFPVMIMAYLENENIDSGIPYDIVEIENKNRDAFLVLKPGKYKIVVSNQNTDAIVYEKTIE